MLGRSPLYSSCGLRLPVVRNASASTTRARSDPGALATTATGLSLSSI